MAVHAAEQMLCPYTTTALSLIKNVNKEHIIPVSLGAPASFYVRADAVENSKMNEMIDEPAGNDPVLRFIAMANKVVSYSGPVSITLPATVRGTNDEVKVKFSSNGLDPTFKIPVVKDPITNRIKGVRGFGDDARKLADEFQKNSAKKGIPVEIGETLSQRDPWVETSFSMDLNIVARELIKICYLMTVRVFSDTAILSSGGAQYRAAILANTIDEIKKTGIRGSVYQPMDPIFPTPVLGKHHLSCIRIGNELRTGVSLFGAFNAFVITPIEDESSSNVIGEMLEIDLVSGDLKSYPDQEIIDQMTKYALAGLNTLS